MSTRLPGLPRCAGGFTIIELMVSMLLGLIVVGGVLGVVLIGLQTFRTNRALSEVQSGTRLAFEMLAHDIRNAQLTGCNNNGRVANVLRNSATAWWANWDNALKGYTGTGSSIDPALTAGTNAGNQVAGTDSIELIGAADTAMSVNTHTPDQFTLNGDIGALENGGIVIVCDPDHAAIFQVENANATSRTLTYNATATGNCSAGLGYPSVCDEGSGTSYTFGPNSQIAPLSAVDWYIGINPAGGRSLYRLALGSGGALEPPVEMVRNVTQMELTYLQSGANSFVSAAGTGGVTDWPSVTAMQVSLTLQSSFQRAGTNAQPLTRTYTTTFALYNRLN